jgi:hypothetical protein
MFSLVAATNKKYILPLILNHLDALHNQISHCFPSLVVEEYDWIRNPFVAIHPSIQLSLEEEEELIDIFSDRTLKLKHSEDDLTSFWIGVEKEYPNISQKAVKILLQFSTTYICELGFSALATIKSTKRGRLLTVEKELRVCLSQICPRIQKIFKNNQAQVSH